MSPLSAWPAADQGSARRLLKWRNLRAPQGVSWSFDVQHKGMVWCWMSWGREAAATVCYKGPVWRVGKEEKILSTEWPLLFFICFVREKMVVNHTSEFVCVEHKSMNTKTIFNIIINTANTINVSFLSITYRNYLAKRGILWASSWPVTVHDIVTYWTIGEWYWHNLQLNFHWICEVQSQWSSDIFLTWPWFSLAGSGEPFEGYRETEMRRSTACTGINRAEVPGPQCCN